MEGPQLGIMMNSLGSGRALRLARPPPGIFCKSYQCHSVACLDREGLEFGDKVIMPQAAFQEAHRLRLKLPLLFKVVNADPNTRRIIGTAGPAPCQFCGVLEFSAPDDQVFLPYWMMHSLLLVEGARVELRSILRPPAGSFVRFKPHDDTFLELAARQGPKALMEGALRRYSVLSEGATILVQHEGENFYLDVVEVRTFATSPTASNVDNGASPSTSPQEPTHAERHGTHSGSDIDEYRDGAGNVDDDRQSSSAGRGTRVRLVCLLGDLDLEVEFCAPHAPLPKQGPAGNFSEHHANGRLPGHPADDEDRHPQGRESRCSVNVASPSPNPSQSSAWVTAGLQAPQAPSPAFDGAAGPSGGQPEQTRLAWPLPAPARARRSDAGDSAPGQGPETPRRRTGQLGIKPSVPPSKTAKRRAFSGKGVSLLGEIPEPRSTDEIVERAGTKRTNCDQQESLPGTVTPAVSATRSTAARVNVALVEAGARLVPETVCADRPSGGGRGGEGRTGSGEGGLLRCKDGASGVGNERSSLPEPKEAGAAGGRLLGEGTPSVVPATQARGRSCSSTGATNAAPVSGVDSGADETTACGRCGKLVPTANLPLHELRCCSSSSKTVRQQHPPHAPPTQPCTKPEQTVPPTPSASRTEPNRTPAATKPTAAGASDAEFPCAYCGLTFREAGPAGEHEEVCGTRTERCHRCCSHVPRRDAESHRRPGGACDAVIAAAERHEKEVLPAGRSLALYGSGGGGGGGGTGEVMGGRFDALLAEAVKSSKAASTALADARAENDARMLETVGPRPPPGRTGLAHSRPGSSNDCGDGNIDCLGKPDEVVVDAVEGAATGGSGGLGTTTGALEAACAGGTGIGAGANHERQRRARESGAKRHPQAAGVIAAPNDASVPVNSRPPPDPSSTSTQATASTHYRTQVSGDVGDSIPCELSSPHRFGTREGAGGPDSRSWTCPRCTLINPHGSASCEACGSVPRSTESTLKATVSGGQQPSTKTSSENDHSVDSVTRTAVEGTSAAAPPASAEGDLRDASEHTSTTDTGGAVRAAGEARSPTGFSPHRKQATASPVPLWAAATAFPPVSSPPPGRASPSTETRTHASRQASPPAALISSPPAVGSSEYTRASGSAPQPCRGTTPSVTGRTDDRERVDAGHVLQLQARHTAPAASLKTSSAAGTAVGVAGPRARCLRSPATFLPADIHPLQPRGRNGASAPRGMRAVRQQQQRYEHATQQASRRIGKPHKMSERRRLMGPPRRLGGIHRPSRLRHVPPLQAAPATGTATVAAAAALTSGSRSVREVGGRAGNNHRHRREQSKESHGWFSPPTTSSRPALQGALGGTVERGGTVSANRPTAPACDVSLSILGRSQVHGGGTSRGAEGPGGGRVNTRGAETGEGPRRPGQEGESTASFKQEEVGGGIGAWGRRFGAGTGKGRAAATTVGVAPLKLRRRVNDTRILEPLVAR